MSCWLVTGEVLKPNLQCALVREISRIRMTNVYGPTASDDITYYLMEQDPGRVMLPVGSPEVEHDDLHCR
ncbi:hypothetical protein P7H21_17045 [Paenibacillus larvae]|nr:hypothetical protein [Paenibacillus larvae]MDT2305312.1 hypothetical protein [Paenibacillus larvae]